MKNILTLSVSDIKRNTETSRIALNIPQTLKLIEVPIKDARVHILYFINKIENNTYCPGLSHNYISES